MQTDNSKTKLRCVVQLIVGYIHRFDNIIVKSMDKSMLLVVFMYILGWLFLLSKKINGCNYLINVVVLGTRYFLSKTTTSIMKLNTTEMWRSKAYVEFVMSTNKCSCNKTLKRKKASDGYILFILGFILGCFENNSPVFCLNIRLRIYCFLKRLLVIIALFILAKIMIF